MLQLKENIQPSQFHIFSRHHYRSTIKPAHHESFLYRQTIKQRFVLFALKKLLRKLKDRQHKMTEEAKGTRYLVGEEESNVFLRGSMKKRVTQNRIQKGVFYATIEPETRGVKNIKRMIMEVTELIEAFSNKGLLFHYRNQQNSKREKTNSTRHRRQAVSISIAELNQVRTLTVQSNHSSLNKNESFLRTPIKQKKQPPKKKLKLDRSITQLYMFKELNKALNNFTHQKHQYQKLAMKHIIKAVYEKATLAKADLMMIERWVMQLQPNWINNISNIQQEVNWFTSLLIRKLIDSGLVGEVQHDFTLKTRSQSTYVSNNEQTEAHSAEKLENMINLFKKIHNELTLVSNRYLCVDEGQRINNDQFKQIVSVSSKIRYLLGFLHKEIQQLLEVVEDGNYSQNLAKVSSQQLYEQNVENMRINNLTRTLKKKYNMTYTSNEVWDDARKSRSLFIRHNTDYKRYLKQDIAK